jgi:hypothetical protein
MTPEPPIRYVVAADFTGLPLAWRGRRGRR